MNPSFFFIVLLHLSFGTAIKLTHVFEWPAGMEYEWPSEANRTQALKDGVYNPKHIYPRYMAAFGTRIFLSIEKFEGIPVSLVSVPTISASSAAPRLTPFPSWEIHSRDYGDCNKIEEASGIVVDSVGRLWMLDHIGLHCNSKLWIFDLSNNDKIELIHQFPFRYYLHDLVIDETPNGSFAYIAQWGVHQIVVFSLENKQFWTLTMPSWMQVISIALSPKEEPRQLYLGGWKSTELYSIPVSVLRFNITNANPKLIGKWTAEDPITLPHGTLPSHLRNSVFMRVECGISNLFRKF
ncbi:Hypothetical predicted protein [Cloeon dipterum]|nr:Hypothetical predicted protein [Cloeon dipterum]